MIDREHDFPISRQAEALGVSRAAVLLQTPANLRPRICGPCRAASTNCISATRLRGQPDAARSP